MKSQVLYSENFDDVALDQKGVIGDPTTPIVDMTGVTIIHH